ncbi:hypothetical protein F0562_029664 [Nyssa sinensis]|uniref:Uncharacterized protein n=1 Tax=Nyssa sinensis TaxID=561372 RepID=A0A5J5B3S4_9ASTE|nr:hypothetical protein F0562_029664 [Nyssa sinensis]
MLRFVGFLFFYRLQLRTGVATGVAIGGDDDVTTVVDGFYDAYGWPQILQFKERNQQQQKCSGSKERGSSSNSGGERRKTDLQAEDLVHQLLLTHHVQMLRVVIVDLEKMVSTLATVGNREAKLVNIVNEVVAPVGVSWICRLLIGKFIEEASCVLGHPFQVDLAL